MSRSSAPEPRAPASGVHARHLPAAVLAGLAAGGCILALSSLYSVAEGYSALGPFRSIGVLLGFGGGSGLGVGIFVEFLIPIVAGFVMVVTLAVMARTHLRFLEFRTRLRALAEGGLLGLVIWAVFYVPVTDHLSGHLTLPTLLFALAEHVTFGAVIGIVLFVVGGPVTCRSHDHPPVRPPWNEPVHDRRER